MSIMVKDILKLETLRGMQLVGGKLGLERCIEWIYVSECFEDPLEGIKWLQGGELVFITGVGMKGDITALTKLIKGISKKKGVGLIVNIGKYIKNIPSESIEIANKLEIPLFTLPWEIKLVEVSKEISNAIILSRIEENSMNHFFSNILFGDGELEGNAAQKAAYFGYNLDRKCCICVIRIDEFEKFLSVKKIDDDINVSKIKFTFRKVVQGILEKYSLKVPIIDHQDEIIFFYRAEENSMNRLDKALKEIQEAIIKRVNGLSVSVGIGNAYDDLKMMKQSLNEAQLAIDSGKCQDLNNTIRKYKEIGIYRILFSIEDKGVLENYYSDILGPIIENNKSILSVQILENYLNENCNITSTAEKLFMHRNTLKYRIKKIEEALGCDLHNFEQCMKVKVALYINKILK
ncbi:MAG: PucR family transcriptional regulator ligand-binding domain-containing protein [Clostridium sp.]|uniref:PucR family transcriptional regulator n=1 Tax=Clostridium sp. TaxID=1506 RepID=UPI0025B958CE|nr:PucR family transcriptional regulator [Clostridium sp.]MCE5220819.1 PucR family transcriptional regulator ligand-binding domain-containing protein [Clostridium sp.]